MKHVQTNAGIVLYIVTLVVTILAREVYTDRLSADMRWTCERTSDIYMHVNVCGATVARVRLTANG